MNVLKTVFVLLIVAVPTYANAGSFLGKSNSMVRIHEAYLAKNYKAMILGMKKALEESQGDPLVEKNVFGLLKKAYEISGKEGLPSDWSLPRAITKMKVTARRLETDSVQYALNIQGNTETLGIIKQLQVKKFPNQIVMDKEAGLGSWYVAPGRNGEEPEYGLSSPRTRENVAAGLYLLKVELMNGEVTDGWFIIEPDMNASTSPIVQTPSEGEVFQTGNPTIRWVNYISPEFRRNEKRSLWLGVSMSKAPDQEDELKWELWNGSPEIEEAVVGVTHDGHGVSTLSSGRYKLSINYQERKRFGDIVVGRASVTRRTFRVAH